MTFSVPFHPDARQDFLEALAWYDDERPGLGQEFWDAVDHALRVGVPLSPTKPASSAGHEVGRILLERFPYTLIVRLCSGRPVYVVAVAHQRRRPGYWRQRLASVTRPRSRRPRR